MAEDALPLIKVVGISAAGKSTLVSTLRRQGYNARPASQEHSQTPDMWLRIRPPVHLIYLHADLVAQRQRRPDVPWSEAWLQTEEERLRHARQHADLIVDTRNLAPADTAAQVLEFLHKHQVAHADKPLPPIPGTGSSHTRPDSLSE